MQFVITTGSTPVLYHGTRLESAQRICKNGFKRSKSRSYTGHGTCLSESITVSYEYGMYETGGCVLEVRLVPQTRWADAMTLPLGARFDKVFSKGNVDAISTFGGNVWVLGRYEQKPMLRILSHQEAIGLMTAEFDLNGSDVGYNSVIDDYASIWWNQADACRAFQRFPGYQQQLTENLQKFTGRTTSTKLVAIEEAMQ